MTYLRSQSSDLPLLLQSWYQIGMAGLRSGKLLWWAGEGSSQYEFLKPGSHLIDPTFLQSTNQNALHAIIILVITAVKLKLTSTSTTAAEK